VQINMEKYAQASWTQLYSRSARKHHIINTSLQIDTQGIFLGNTLSLGPAFHRQGFTAHIEGANAKVLWNNITLVDGTRKTHHYANILHNVPNAESQQHFKNVLMDEGTASVNGSVCVSRDAHLTNASQLINHLQLSAKAQAYTKPNLRILADDVKCSHGTTVGQIEEEQLFYLLARGLSEEAAGRILMNAFLAELIDKITCTEIKMVFERILTHESLKDV